MQYLFLTNAVFLCVSDQTRSDAQQMITSVYNECSWLNQLRSDNHKIVNGTTCATHRKVHNIMPLCECIDLWPFDLEVEHFALLTIIDGG